MLMVHKYVASVRRAKLVHTALTFSITHTAP